MGFDCRVVSESCEEGPFSAGLLCNLVLLRNQEVSIGLLQRFCRSLWTETG